MRFLNLFQQVERLSRPAAAKACLRVEPLESRVVPYAVTGNAWPNPQLITLSFVPDGTLMTTNAGGNVYSNLFSTFNAKWSTATWQAEVLKAAQLWAQAANINFAVVSDNGTPAGGGKYQQGDPGMGDIRIGGYNFNNTKYLAGTYLPPPANNYSIAGDVNCNTQMASTSARLTTSRPSPSTSWATPSAWTTPPSTPPTCTPATTTVNGR